MKFPYIEIENFCAITKAKITLADRGLVLIQGVNHDDSSAASNGAGKSSVPDALCWCFYGTTARGVTGDDVINDTAGKGTIVSTPVIDGSDCYLISRHRKHKTGKNSLTVVQTMRGGIGCHDDLTKGTDKLTQEVVNKILGCSYDVFKNSVYAGQEQMPDLPAQSDKNLKILIEEAAGVTLLEEAYKEARDRAAKAKADHQQVLQAEGQANQQVAWIDQQIVNAKAQFDSWAVNRKTLIDMKKAGLGPMIASVKSLDAQIAAIDEHLIADDIANCDKAIAAVNAENAELLRLKTEETGAQGRVNARQNDLSLATRRLAAAETEIQQVQHKIGCACNECGRPLTENELGAARNAAEAKRDALKQNVDSLSSELERAQKDAQAAASAVSRFQATMTDISAVNAQRAQKQQELTAFNGLVQSRRTQADQARMLGEEIKRLMGEENPYTTTLQNLEAQKTQAATTIASFATQKAQTQAAVDLAETVVKVFSPAGVRAHILDEVTPFLNQQTAKYLSIMSDGNIHATWTTLVQNSKGELREKFSIEVENDKGAKSFAGLSGGEKRKVRVASALALQDLVATRASKPIELFVGDEIDDALDVPGLERLMQILEEKAQERGSVFVISHNALTDWISQIVQVEKKAGQTVVTEMMI